MKRAGINRVYDLSIWDNHDDWKGWDFFGVPERLKKQKLILEELLAEAAPVNRKTRDSWGWGKSGRYTIAEAYNALQPSRNNRKPPEFWRKVWDPLALPKINFFFWTLVHNKLLTGDNLEKKNIAGPHRCEQCRSSSETTKHLFMDCNFAKEVWNLMLHDLKITVPQLHSVADLFDTW